MESMISLFGLLFHTAPVCLIFSTCQKRKLFNSVLQVSGSWIESLVRHSWRLCLSTLLDAQDRHILTQFDRVLLDVRSFALRRLFLRGCYVSLPRFLELIWATNRRAHITSSFISLGFVSAIALLSNSFVVPLPQHFMSSLLIRAVLLLVRPVLRDLPF